MAIETLFAQADCDVTDAKNNTETLRDFAMHAVALRNVLYQGGSFNEAEFPFMENHFQVLEMAHLWWKRKHGPTMTGAVLR
jgi:hypothetical protein